MINKKFPRQALQDLLFGNSPKGFRIVRDQIADTTRWTIVHELIFSDGDEFYRTTYRAGATEAQEEYPFDAEFCPDEIECQQVRAVERLAVDYEPVA